MLRTFGRALACGAVILGLSMGTAFAHDTEPGGEGSPGGGGTQLNPAATKYFKQAEAYEKAKKWGLAVGAYQQVLKIEPALAEAWSNMGYCYRKMNQTDKALDAYKHAIALKPGLPHAHEYLGRTLLAMGNKDGANREYEILKRLDAKLAADLLKAIQAGNPDLGDDD